MEFRINNKDLKTLLEHYYKTFEDRDVSITTSVSRGTVGYGMSETDSAIPKVKLKEIIEAYGAKLTNVQELNKTEIEDILRTLLEDKINITNISFDSGIDSKIVGYGLNEHTDYTPYFKGIIVYGKTPSKSNNL